MQWPKYVTFEASALAHCSLHSPRAAASKQSVHNVHKTGQNTTGLKKKQVFPQQNQSNTTTTQQQQQHNVHNAGQNRQG